MKDDIKFVVGSNHNDSLRREKENLRCLNSGNRKACYSTFVTLT